MSLLSKIVNLSIKIVYRHAGDDVLELKLKRRMRGKMNSGRRGGQSISTLMIYWDFHIQPFSCFPENGLKNDKVLSLENNILLMSEHTTCGCQEDQELRGQGKSSKCDIMVQTFY